MKVDQLSVSFLCRCFTVISLYSSLVDIAGHGVGLCDELETDPRRSVNMCISTPNEPTRARVLVHTPACTAKKCPHRSTRKQQPSVRRCPSIAHSRNRRLLHQ